MLVIPVNLGGGGGVDHLKAVGIKYSEIHIWPCLFRLWQTDFSPTQLRLAKLFRPATAEAHITLDRYISWHESLLVIFGRRNVNPKISAAFSSVVPSQGWCQHSFIMAHGSTF